MNLLNLIQSQLSPQAVGQISNAVGESPDGTRSALATAIPALLASLVGKATASPNGLNDVFNLIKQGPGQGSAGWSDSITDTIGGLTPGTTQPGAQPAGQSLVSSLLGSRAGAVTDFISSRSGVRGTSVMSLLSMVAPLIMGTLGKQVTSQGLGASGLGQLLGSQTQHLKDALPPGLADTLGVGKLLSGTQAIPRLETPGAARPAEPAYAGSTEGERVPAKTRGILRWPLIIVALALGAWVFAQLTHRRADEMGGTRERTEIATGRGEHTPTISSGATPGSPADNLAKAISAGDWNKTIVLEGATFDSAGALPDSALSKIQEIGMVLSGAPNVKVEIVGYGDTAEAGQSRAETIKSSLASSGVAEDRISTRGQTGIGRPTINLKQ